jgi:hypothetical protein
MAAFNPIIYGRFWVITEDTKVLINTFVLWNRCEPSVQITSVEHVLTFSLLSQISSL